MEKIEFKIKGIFKADPEKCYREMPDVVTPENVLEIARDETTELHKCFEWDDSVAAEKYRLRQARQIIQMLVVKTVPDDNITYRPRLYQTSSVRNRYEKASFFIENKDEYKILLERATRELRDFQKRYKEIAEMEEVNEAIENFLTSNY